MFSRLAFRSARAASLPSGKNAPKSLRPLAFHTAPAKKEEEKATAEATVAVKEPGFLSQYGLDDFKITGPIGLALTIPAISNGWYVLNEESQLACCFLLFCTSVYKFGGDAIASYFDERAAAILSEHNAIEGANIKLAKETLKTHESLLNIHEDIAAVAEAHKEAVALMCEVQAYKLRHKTRERFIKNLDAIKEIESSYNLELQTSMVNSATKKVRAIVEKGDKKLKESAFKHALDILSEAPIDEKKEDDVAALFIKEVRAYAESLEGQQGKVIKLTDAEQEELQADLDAYMLRYDMQDAEFKAPNEVKLQLFK